MDANTGYEIKAEAFRLMTGMMAPGKDEGMAGSAHTYEERCQQWGDWLESHWEIINAMLKSMDTVTGV